MKQTLKIILLVTVLCSLTFAQQNADWLQQVQKLARRIQFLESVAQRYHVQRAIQTLHTAGQKLELARTQFQSSHYAKAHYNFTAAQKLVDLAERSVLFKPAAKAFLDAELLIQRAQRLLQSSQDKDARYMLNRARSFLRDAEKAYRNAQFVRGQELQRIALFFANKAIAMAGGGAAEITEQFNFDEQLRNLRILYQSAQAQAQNNTQIKKLLKNADAFLNEARKLYGQGQYRSALTQLQIGERLLYRAIDMGQQTEQGQQERLDNNLQSLGRYIQSIQKNAQGNMRAQRLLRKARQFWRAARRDADNNNYAAASAKIDLAQRIANQALRYLNVNSDENTFEERLQEVNQLYDALVKTSALKQDGYTRYFVGRAQQLIQQAKGAHDKGQEKLALLQLNLTVRILNRLMTHRSSAEYSPQQVRELELRFQRISRVIERLNSPIRYDVLKKELQQAGQQLQEKNYPIAETLLDLLQKEINVLIRRSQNR